MGINQPLLPRVSHTCTQTHSKAHTNTSRDAHIPLTTCTYNYMQTDKCQQTSTHRLTNVTAHRNMWKHAASMYTNTHLHIST